ncbi:Alpha/Beta hydrolase protein [Aspergillus filifer]
MPSRSFEIDVPEADLDRLCQKLDTTTFPDELDNAGWDMGVPLEEIKRLTVYSCDGFNWREQERWLNKQFKQFTVSVSVDGFEDLEIYYLHHTSKTPGPGSFIEATKLIPLLPSGDGDKPVFDVVAPSLPNFGFSSGVKKRGFGLHQYAEAMHKVMTALGYTEYDLLPIPFSPHREACLSTVWTYLTKGNGYATQQATRPQTLGYGIHDSPYPWTDGEILMWVSIYLFSRAGPAASVRIYYESAENRALLDSMNPAPKGVKVGVAQFRGEIMRWPMSWVRVLGGEVVRAREFDVREPEEC